MPRFRAWFCRVLGLVRKQNREAEISRGHNLLFSRIILAADRSFNAIRKLARAIPLSREIFLSCSQPKAQKAIYSVDNRASPRHLPSWKREEFDREIRILYGSGTITSPTNFLPRLV